MRVTVTGPPLGSLYLRPVAPYGQREKGKTPAHQFDRDGCLELDVEPGKPYRVLIQTAEGVIHTIEANRSWSA